MTSGYMSSVTNKVISASVGEALVSVTVTGGDYECDSTIALDRPNASSFAVSLLQELGYEVSIAPPRLKAGDFARVIGNNIAGDTVPLGTIVKIVQDDGSSIPYRGQLADGGEGWFTEADLEPADGEYELVPAEYRAIDA